MLTGLPDLSKGSVANPTTYNIVTSEEAATIMPVHIAELWLGYGGGLTMLDLLTYGFDNRSELVAAEASAIRDFPPEVLIQLQHLILSHHGRQEYGSPTVPMTVEAFLLSQIDEMDAKMYLMEQLLSLM